MYLRTKFFSVLPLELTKDALYLSGTFLGFKFQAKWLIKLEGNSLFNFLTVFSNSLVVGKICCAFINCPSLYVKSLWPSYKGMNTFSSLWSAHKKSFSTDNFTCSVTGNVSLESIPIHIKFGLRKISEPSSETLSGIIPALTISSLLLRL